VDFMRKKRGCYKMIEFEEFRGRIGELKKIIDELRGSL